MTGPTLVALAAGTAHRFGRLKQLARLGPSGQTLLDYALFDAARSGFDRAVLVVRPEVEGRFRAHFDTMSTPLPVGYAHQTLEPTVGAEGVGGPRRPSTEIRQKPWGTAHAVLAASSLLDGPFAVVNADDFYGPSAYRAAANHLAQAHGHALVTYRLDRTLSEVGGVSRGLCRVSVDGVLESVQELSEVRRTGPGLITGISATGARIALAGHEPVSMNLWAFTPSILPALEARFRAFLLEEGPNAEAEFRLPDVVAAEVASGGIAVTALPTEAESFGLTFAGDQARVRARLAALTARGDYPETPVRGPLPEGTDSRDVPDPTHESARDPTCS